MPGASESPRTSSVTRAACSARCSAACPAAGHADFFPCQGRRLCACGPVEDPTPDQGFEAWNPQPPRRHAASHDDRSGLELRTVVKGQDMRLTTGFQVYDTAYEDEKRPEEQRLKVGPGRQFVPTQTVRKAGVVEDLVTGGRLPAERRGLHYNRPQPLRGPVDGSG